MLQVLTKFSAEVIGKIALPGSSASLRIGVFQTTPDGQKSKIGEYDRNYHSFMDTFQHFQINGKDLALYSSNYSCTRIMTLPDCKDIGGEPIAGEGFCPTGYYIPSYLVYEMTFDNGRKTTYRLYDPNTETCKRECSCGASNSEVISGLLFTPFGFVSGCHWGDDTSDKLEVFDLSKADQGVIKRDDRFGYIELPRKMKLKDAIDMCDYGDDDEPGHIRIATESYYDLETGKKRGD